MTKNLSALTVSALDKQIKVRSCSGAVVWRYKNDEVQVLLVKSTSGKSWCFPKGGIEPGLTRRQNAVKEVWEEAGCIGHVGDEVARYRYSKAGVPQQVTMYEMECVSELTHYPEADVRKRKWFSLPDARQKLNKQLRGVLQDFIYCREYA